MSDQLTGSDHRAQYGSSTRDGFGIGLLKLMEADERVVVLCADLSESTRVEAVAEHFPERFVQVGVAEQNLAGIAAGMALGGQIPFIASYAAFSPGNNWGIIRSSICYSNLPVRIMGGHAGLATGADGATHQALEDLAVMRALPNMTIITPADAQEAAVLTQQTTQIGGPVYIRTSKLDVPSLSETASQAEPIELGRARLLRPGSHLAILAHGTMVARALSAATQLAEQHIHAAVYSMHTLKPLPTEQLLGLSSAGQPLITIEDHQRTGGLGSAIAEFLADHQLPNRLVRLGVNDQFGQSGSADELYQHYQLVTTDIVNQALHMI